MKLSIVILSFLSLFVACTNEHDSSPAYKKDFVCIQTDYNGNPIFMYTDNGKKYNITTQLEQLQPNSVYRNIAYFIISPDSSSVRIASMAQTLSLNPIEYPIPTINLDSVSLVSIWIAPVLPYINLVLDIKNTTDKHTFAIFNKGMTTATDGSQILNLQLYHKTTGEESSFYHTLYVSCPLLDYINILKPNRDSIYFSLTTFKEGEKTHKFAY